MPKLRNVSGSLQLSDRFWEDVGLPISYLIVLGWGRGYFPRECGEWPWDRTTDLHLEPKLRKVGTLFPRPHIFIAFFLDQLITWKIISP